MLTQHTIDIIKATVPAVSLHANDITAHFYPLMFREYPEVKRFFNQSNQAGNAQPKALANALVAYAANIENLSVLESAVSRIVNKHVSLNILPEQYAIVGECLLKSIKAVLGDAATDAVIEAWGLAYWQLATG
jgi:nitric oxide dioxygenase